MGQVLRCKECDAEMTLTPLPPIEGEEHGLLMKIDGLPALRCANGHTRFVSPTFPAEKGFLRKRYCSPSCGEVLDTHDAGRVHADHSLALDGLQPIAEHVELPAYRCASCGHECVEPRDTMVSDLMQASAHACRSAQIPPG